MLIEFRCATMAYGDFEDELVAAIVGLESVENWGKLFGIEFHCIFVRLAPFLMD